MSILAPGEAVVSSVVHPAPAVGCSFDLGDGRKCLSLQIKSRGLCIKHYAQLLRAGAFHAGANAPFDPAAIELNRDRLIAAKGQLERMAPYAVQQIRHAIKHAAAKGDSRPAEWVLLHSRAIAPVAVDRQSSSSGVTVNVGVALAGASERKIVGTQTIVESADEKLSREVERGDVV